MRAARTLTVMILGLTAFTLTGCGNAQAWTPDDQANAQATVNQIANNVGKPDPIDYRDGSLLITSPGPKARVYIHPAGGTFTKDNIATLLTNLETAGLPVTSKACSVHENKTYCVDNDLIYSDNEITFLLTLPAK